MSGRVMWGGGRLTLLGSEAIGFFSDRFWMCFLCFFVAAALELGEFLSPSPSPSPWLSSSWWFLCLRCFLGEELDDDFALISSSLAPMMISSPYFLAYSVSKSPLISRSSLARLELSNSSSLESEKWVAAADVPCYFFLLLSSGAADFADAAWAAAVPFSAAAVAFYHSWVSNMTERLASYELSLKSLMSNFVAHTFITFEPFSFM